MNELHTLVYVCLQLGMLMTLPYKHILCLVAENNSRDLCSVYERGKLFLPSHASHAWGSCVSIFLNPQVEV